jgi:RND family efflux transporter MFP subunit
MAEDKAKLLKSLRIERSAAAPAAPRRRGWPTIAAVALALFGAGGALAYYAAPDWRGDRRAVAALLQPPAAAPAPPVAAEPARPRALVASGYVVARRKATVAAEITGKVVEVLIEEGMVIKQGDVVARLDSVLAERDLALARSRADAAEAAIGAIAADLRDAERIYNRAQSLVARNAMSEADMTKAEAHAGVLRAQLKQAQAQFETAKLDANRAADVLEKHHIRAPFNGVVVERSAQPGEMISPLSVGGYTRTGICTLVDMDSIEVEVDVNEAFIGRVQAGMPVEAVLDAYPDWTIPAAVIAVVPTANREKATVKVRIGLKVKDPRVLPDMAVKVTFETGSSGDAGHDKSAAN